LQPLSFGREPKTRVATPIVWANSLDQVGGPPNLSMKTKLKELRPFLFRLVEEKIHPIPKMKYEEGGILAKVSTGKEFRWIIHF
jgi:hypothetical protein